jgi:hypothetical protein
MGWTFPWSVVAVRGLNVCLRKIDYPLIWKLLKEEGITHFNAAPTVNTLLVAAKEAIKLPHLVQVTVTASPPSDHFFEQMVRRALDVADMGFAYTNLCSLSRQTLTSCLFTFTE